MILRSLKAAAVDFADSSFEARFGEFLRRDEQQQLLVGGQGLMNLLPIEELWLTLSPISFSTEVRLPSIQCR